MTARILALHTERLLLSPLASNDGAELHRLWTTPEVRRFLWDNEIIPIDRTMAIIAKSEQLFEQHGFGLWGARLQKAPRLIGFGGLWYFREPPELELLYGVAGDEWGRGYASEIAARVVEYAFDTLAMTSVRASTDVGNTPSTRVLEKVGFRETRRGVVNGLETIFYERCRDR